MRTIKFRTWNKEAKRLIGPDELMGDQDVMIRINFSTNIYKTDNIDFVGSYKEVARQIEKYQRENFVLQQYTGLEDKNGKEIYEGDIVEITKGQLKGTSCSIEYHSPEFTLTMINNKEPSFPMDISWKLAEEIKIIGNIYENPELLSDPV